MFRTPTVLIELDEKYVSIYDASHSSIDFENLKKYKRSVILHSVFMSQKVMWVSNNAIDVFKNLTRMGNLTPQMWNEAVSNSQITIPQ